MACVSEEVVVSPSDTIADVISLCYKKYITDRMDENPFKHGYLEYKCKKYKEDVEISSTGMEEGDVALLYVRPAKDIIEALERYDANLNKSFKILAHPSAINIAYSVRYFKDELTPTCIDEISTYDIPEVFTLISDTYTLSVPDLGYITPRMADWFACNSSDVLKINAAIEWIESSHACICYQFMRLAMSISEPQRSNLIAVYMAVGKYAQDGTYISSSPAEILKLKGDVELSSDAEDAIHNFPPRPFDLLILASIKLKYKIGVYDLQDVLDRYIHGKKINFKNMISYDMVMSSLGDNEKSVEVWLDYHDGEDPLVEFFI